MSEGMAWDNIPAVLLTDCAQLVKANSIEGLRSAFGIIEQATEAQLGNKKDNLTIIYTPADNLLKSGDMDVGQVAFHSDKRVRNFFIFTLLTLPYPR